MVTLIVKFVLVLIEVTPVPGLLCARQSFSPAVSPQWTPTSISTISAGLIPQQDEG